MGQLHGVCTDGAKAMVGNIAGFVSRIKNVSGFRKLHE